MALLPERGRVWILEDSALAAELARRTLEPAHEIELFHDGSALLERVANGELPHAVVLDWELPGLSGPEVCRALRLTHSELELPVLMLTVYGNKQAVVLAFEAGANDYVTKPYDVSELAARVATLVRSSRLQRAHEANARHVALAADVGGAIARGRGLHEIAQGSATAIAHSLGATLVGVWSRRRGQLTLAGVHGAEVDAVPDEILCRVVDTRAPYLGDARNDGRLVGLPPHLRSLAAIPLIDGDQLLGVLVILGREPLPGVTRDALHPIADLLGLGLGRARAEEDRAAALAAERGARAEAEAANRSKDEFLAVVSHELRTPLNAITGWTRMLLRGSVDPARTKTALETIERSARAQEELINDLLDVSRIISGKLTLNVAQVNVAGLVELALTGVRLAADAKNIRLEAQVAPDVGVVAGDVDRLRQVLWNLLSNAIKFTDKGGLVTMAATREAESVLITVTDTGRGIDPAFLPYVFDRFRQADASATRSSGGLGLGLAIVRQLIELHGGVVSATSGGLGAGATFKVRLPGRPFVTAGPSFARPDATADSGHGAPSAVLSAPLQLVGRTALIVDDQQDSREVVKAVLEGCSMKVTTAASAEEALSLLATGRPQVLLSDIGLPGQDGLSLIREVRALPPERGGRTPAVALSAYAYLEDRSRALGAGYNQHVSKPVDPEELVKALTYVLGLG